MNQKIDGSVLPFAPARSASVAGFSASECFNVGVDLGSPVSLDYFDRRPFAFDARIKSVSVQLR